MYFDMFLKLQDECSIISLVYNIKHNQQSKIRKSKMGQSTPTPQNPPPLSHKKFKQIQFSKSSSTMSTSLAIEQQQDFQRWQSQLSRLRKFDEYYLLLPKSYEYTKRGVCGTSGLLNVEYEFYPYLLHEEILNRANGQQGQQQTGQWFREVEMWYLLYGMVSAVEIFKELGIKVGDIQAKNIFMNEDGQLKLSNQLSWPCELPNYKKQILEHELTYLSPEQLGFVKQARMDIYQQGNGKDKKKGGLDQYVCQSFSIGLVMLQAATLKLSDGLYIGNIQFDQKQLKFRLADLMENKNDRKYSMMLRATILGLCELDPADRLSASLVYDRLKGFDSEITNLRPCEIRIPVGKFSGGLDSVVDKGSNNKSVYHSNNSININISKSYLNQNPSIYNSINNKSISAPPQSLPYTTQPPAFSFPPVPTANPYQNTYVSQSQYQSVGPYGGSGEDMPQVAHTSSLYYVGAVDESHGGRGFSRGGVDGYLVKESQVSSVFSNTRPFLQMGSGNNYLNAIYSNNPTIKTPTFNTAPTVLNTLQTPTFPTPINLTQPSPPLTPSPTFQPLPHPRSIPHLAQKQPLSLATPTLGPLAPASTATLAPVLAPTLVPTLAPTVAEPSSQKYSFSNMSSISRQHQYSDMVVDQMGAFTPSKDADLVSMDLLKKIDEDIERSRSLYSS